MASAKKPKGKVAELFSELKRLASEQGFPFHLSIGDHHATMDAPRRLIHVRKRENGDLMDQVLAAMLAEKLEMHVKETVAEHKQEMKNQSEMHKVALLNERTEAHATGYADGRREAKDEQGPHFEKLVADRLCEDDMMLPWPVGVIVAGEQHRILQALADYCDRGDLDFPVERFYKDALALPHVPLRMDSPEPVNTDNCDAPPLPDDGNYKWCFPNMDEFWRYYLWQSTADDDVGRLEVELP